MKDEQKAAAMEEFGVLYTGDDNDGAFDRLCSNLFEAGYAARESEQVAAWVPVSGGNLPEPGVKCLVTVLSYGSRQPVVEPYVLYRKECGNWYCAEEDSPYEDDVIAWMPLPKPFVAAQEEG